MRGIAVLLLAAVKILAAEIDVRAIQESIRAKGAQWSAGETWISKLPAEQRKMTMGLVREPVERDRMFKLPPVENLPVKFSWRDNHGDFITPVKNQGQCGSCSYFSTLAAVEAWMRIKTGNPTLAIDLSEQFILSCGSVGSCEAGASIQGIHRFVRDQGTPSEACFPYREYDGVPCTNACADWASQLTKISDYATISYEQTSVEDIKNAVYRKPVVVDMDVYSDFQTYIGGVYEHVTGDIEGAHAVLIYGWDDSEQCWLCKNSWGTNWGESGFFRIKWGQANIAQTVVMIWEETNGSPKMSVSPGDITLTCAPNEQSTRYIKVSNNGSGLLEFATQISCDKMPMTYFHQTDFHALDGLSWWCGSEQLKGYDNRWLQYLDTPQIDLSATAKPILTFHAFWAVEESDSSGADYDGWDGGNVWVSTDGGKKFRVIHPVSPAYDCNSLFSFGEEWNMGYDIAGWSGKSESWREVTVDLTSYRSASTVLRFAFASDAGKCTRDDSSLLGIFLDDISIKDGNTTLFIDTANSISTMQASGYGNEEVKWIELPVSAGTVAAGEYLMLPVHMSASALASGVYTAQVAILNNSVGFASKAISIALDVWQPSHDLGVNGRVWPLFEMPAFLSVSPTTILKNWGQRHENDLHLSCRIYDPTGTAVYENGQAVSVLNAGMAANVAFDSFAPRDTGDYRLQFTVQNASGDENGSNDEFSSWIRVTDRIDDFEQVSPLWDYGQTWGVMDKFTGGHQSTFAVQANNGAQYLDNMDNSLTLRYGFDLSSVASAGLKFWQRYSMEKGKDYLLVQGSNDGAVWTTLDSITGSNLRWHEKEVSLLPFVGPGNENVQIRFRFISNGSKTAIGPILDDLRIVWSQPTQTAGRPSLVVHAEEYALLPNYPNPFNPVTHISYRIPENAWVRITVTNLQGQKVAELTDSMHQPGSYTAAWDARSQPSGMYFYRMRAVGRSGRVFDSSGKMLLLK